MKTNAEWRQAMLFRKANLESRISELQMRMFKYQRRNNMYAEWACAVELNALRNELSDLELELGNHL